MERYIGPAISIIVFVIWLVISKDFSFAFSRAVSVLIISCPLILGAFSYMSFKIGKKVADKNGIMFKNRSALINAGKVQNIAMDLTGTITEGHYVVTDISSADHFTMSGYAVGGYSDDELLEVAALLEKKNDHPVAKAIMKFADDILIEAEDEITDFLIYPGQGLEGYLDGILIRGGNLNFIEEKVSVPAEIKLRAEELAATGKTPVFFSRGKRLLGLITVSDNIKKESEKAISELKGLGLRVIMLTGNNEETAKAIADEIGVDEVIPGVSSNNKENVVKELMSRGKLAVVGKNKNDAPSLKIADTGITTKEDDEAAIEAADVVLTNNSLFDVACAIRLSRQILKNRKENYIWLAIYSIIMIPLAAGVFYPVSRLVLNPLFCFILMGLITFFAFANSMRLNDFDIDDTSKDKRIVTTNK